MANVGLLMDVVLLAFLAATVGLAFKLNLNLRHFRESRSAMEGLVNRLSSNIEHAEKAIAGLQVAARHTGSDLDKKIKESKLLLDDLQFMNEAGNKLAERLEKLASSNRELIEKMENAGSAAKAMSSPVLSNIVVDTGTDSRSGSLPASGASGFRIMDRDMEPDFEDEMDDLQSLDFELANANVSGLQSQAEREFLEALMKRKTSGSQN